MIPGFNKYASLPNAKTLREAVVSLYGAKCVICGFADSRALQVDHKHNNGARERKRLSYYQILKRALEHPDDYQLLCANCNWIKEFEYKEYLKQINPK